MFLGTDSKLSIYNPTRGCQCEDINLLSKTDVSLEVYNVLIDTVMYVILSSMQLHDELGKA